MEIREVSETETGICSKQTFAVVDYTKIVAGDREVYLSSTARKIHAEIISCNQKHEYSDNGYLFLNENGRIYSKSIDY